ncbi:helix-turn-helix transcriptional regulator [Nonomuraea fuscirosea]|jgi:transcriptional regulator with XRE-family HTH domain|uniref:helix-turn-helix domain-containing protein n=1 Tax=Nonomuraea fuscirosea TaxID=1291556 RepID=UPI0034269F15
MQNRWGPLRGNSAGAHVLARALRGLIDDRELSVRALADRIHYSRTTISTNLSGERRPRWEFIEAVVGACAPADLDMFKELWEAADGNQTSQNGIENTQEIPVVAGGRRLTRRAAALALLALVLAGTSVVLLTRSDPLDEVQDCLTGVWRLEGMTSTGPDHGHAVTYIFKSGKSLVTFNENGTGVVESKGLQIEMVYSGSPPWAPILETHDGSRRFAYTVNQDRDRVRISFKDGKGTVMTSVQGAAARESRLWATSSYVTCTEKSLFLQVPDEGHLDHYVPDRSRSVPD